MEDVLSTSKYHIHSSKFGPIPKVSHYWVTSKMVWHGCPIPKKNWDNTWLNISNGSSSGYVSSVKWRQQALTEKCFVTTSHQATKQLHHHVEASMMQANTGKHYMATTKCSVGDIFVYRQKCDSLLLLGTDIGVYASDLLLVPPRRLGDDTPFDFPVFDTFELDSE